MNSRKIFHRLVSIDRVLEMVEHEIKLGPLDIETVSLRDAFGRVLAEDIVAPIDYPPFDRSEVDGYAVRVEDIYGADELNPICLEICGSVDVGEEPSQEIDRPCVIEISTGAPIPRGANAVVMEEHTIRKDNHVCILRSVAPRTNIAIAGSDIAKGELVLLKGTRLGVSEIAILAALGIDKVKVYRKPRIAIISTGKELVSPGKPLRLGQIYETNSFVISSLLRLWGCEPHFLGVVPDNEKELEDLLLHAVANYDLVITSGGTSAGYGDTVYRVVERLGKVLVHGLKTKPGKPTLIAVINNKLVIGLPGFPFSAIAIMWLVVKPIIDKLSGTVTVPSKVLATIAERFRKDVGKTLLLPVVINVVKDRIYAVPIPFTSGSISIVRRCDGIAILPEERETIDEGEQIEVVLTSAQNVETLKNRILFMGSHDHALPLIIKECGLSNTSKIIYVGSLNGIKSVAKGYADIAPTHLLDEESHLYNIPFIEKLGLKNKVVLVRGYRRRLVLAFKKGNPKNIRGFEDLLREDIVFVNRNKGSGTRTFIDYQLKQLAKKLGIEFEELVKKIRGYNYEVNTHNAVAAAISQNRADVGVCIELVAQMYGLDYIPLTWEEYDFVISKDSLDKDGVRIFLEFLRSPTARSLVNRLKGYEAPPDMGTIILS